MRNLKRALSLALASIMLLGMMVTGVGAASTSSFTDYDQIVNQEAVEVTSGLGIFDGYTDGSFGPENVVTRAEMAVIICKILNGADVDPGNFTGISHFTDVPSWAEGYVNYCASMNIVVGVGDGKFNPNGTVTTVEATTMLLKALGYFVDENDQLGADWKTTVTGRATYLSLYGSLVLNANEGLTRDNVAELVFNTIQAQRVAYDDNRNLYVKNTLRTEVVTNGTEDWDNTLAEDTFGMWIVDGVVTANSYTSNALSEAVNNAPRTNVLFDSALEQDYPAHSYPEARGVEAQYPFEYTTGLDMIGHAARVYYRMVRNAPEVFAIVDQATKVEYITYNKNTTNLANAANEAGFRRNTILDIGEANWKVNYSWDDTVGSLNTDTTKWDNGEVNLEGPSVAATLLLISNDSDFKVNTVIVLDQYLDTVRRVTEVTDGKTEYRLTTHDGDDQNIPHGTFAVDDYVVVTDIGNQGKMLNFAAPEKVTASISKITGMSDGNGTVKSIVADGTTYTGSPVAHHEASMQVLDNSRSLENTTNFENIQTIGETTLLLDFQGKCIGIAEDEIPTNYAYAAQFGVTHNNGSLNLNTQYALTVKLHFVDGTSGVYRVNTDDGTTVNNTFKGLTTSEHGNENYAKAVAKLLNDGLVTDQDSTEYPYINDTTQTYNTATYSPKDTYTAADSFNAVTGIGVSGGKLTGITDDTTTGLGIYKVSVRSDNSVVLKALTYDEAPSVNQTGTRLIAGHSTFVKSNGQNAVQLSHGSRNMYQTSKTVYFYVDGCESAKGSGVYEYNGRYGDLSVGVKTGLTNAVGITVGSNKDENDRSESIEQAFVTCPVNHGTHANGERDTVEAVMIYGYDMGYDDTLYFYKEGNYHLTEKPNSRASSLVSITYDLYTADGEIYSVTYDDGGKYYDIDVARQMVADKNTGYYKVGSSNLDPQFIVDRDGVKTGTGNDQNGCKFNVLLTDSPKGHGDPSTGVQGELEDAKNVYILNATAYHNEFESNIFTEIDSVGGISENTLVVDTTGNNIDSVRTIADKCDAGNTVRISYTYKTTGDNSYKVKVIFVTDYNPKENVTDNVNTVGSNDWVSYNTTLRTFTVRWHAVDHPLTTAYVENLIRNLTGESNVVANLNAGTVKVGENANWITGNYGLTFVETVYVRYGSNKMYVDKSPAAPVDVTSLKLGSDDSVIYGAEGRVLDSSAATSADSGKTWTVANSLLNADLTLVKGVKVTMTTPPTQTDGRGEPATTKPTSFQVTYGETAVDVNDIVPVGAVLTAKSSLAGYLSSAENYIITVSEDGVEKNWDSTFNGHKGNKVATLSYTVSNTANEVTFGWEWGVLLKVADATVTYGETTAMTETLTSASKSDPAYAILRQGWSWRLSDSYDQYHWAHPGLCDETEINSEIYNGMDRAATVTYNSDTHEVDGEDVPIYGGEGQAITLYGNLVRISQDDGSRATVNLSALKTALEGMSLTIYEGADGALYAFGEDTIKRAEGTPDGATGFVILVGSEETLVPYNTSVKELFTLSGTGPKTGITFPQTLMMSAKAGEDGSLEEVTTTPPVEEGSEEEEEEQQR